MNKFTKTLFAIVLFAVAGISTLTQAYDGYDRRIDVLNLSDNPIWSIRLTNLDDPSWHGNLLDGYGSIGGYDEVVLQPGHPDGYCRFDALVDFADGTEVTVRDINLCEISTLKVNDNGDAWVA